MTRMESSPPESSARESSAPPTRWVITVDNFAYVDPGTAPPGPRSWSRTPTTRTVTADGGGATFDVTIAAGETAAFTAPDRPGGDYPFVCTFHAGMTGTLVEG